MFGIQIVKLHESDKYNEWAIMDFQGKYSPRYRRIWVNWFN